MKLLRSNGVLARSYPIHCLHKDFILGSINREEKWFLSEVELVMAHRLRGFCWGSYHVEGHCLNVCLFDCRSVDLRLGRG